MPFTNAWRFLALAVVLAALSPAAAHAKIIELGSAAGAPGPACPTVSDEDRCQVVTRTTAYQAVLDGEKDLYVAPRDGRIVAWTMTLAPPNAKDQRFFEEVYGGAARARITVIEQQEKGSVVNEVVAQSGTRVLTDYFGKRVQFPLVDSLPVEKGQRIALTVPTWAPTYEDEIKGKTAWRASRTNENDSCSDIQTLSAQTALQTVGAAAPFQCFYPNQRLFYSATLITEPRISKQARKRQKREERERREGTRSVRSTPSLGDAASARLLGGASAP